MALVINNTLSDQFANSYIDVDYADDYFESHYDSTKATSWAALSTAQKTTALINACRSMESMKFTVFGSLWYANQLIWNYQSHQLESYSQATNPPTKFVYTQNLQFPRSVDINSTTGETYIPEEVMTAQCEQAIYAISFDESILASEIQGLLRESATVGPISVRNSYGNVGSSVAPLALEMLRRFLIRGTTGLKRS